MVAQTGSGESASQDPENGANPRLVLQTDSGDHYKELRGKKESGKEMTYELTRNKFSPNLPECLHEQDIKGVYLQAPLGGSDGWYVTSITTYVRPIDMQYSKITSDLSFEKWVDYDEDNARLIHLSSVAKVAANCLTTLKISAMTGNHDNAGFSTSYAQHKIALRLKNGQVSYATLTKSAYRNTPYDLNLDLSSAFSPSIRCIQQADIKEVFLKYGGSRYGRDTWLIASIRTSVTDTYGIDETLTNDQNYNHWLYYGNGGKRVLSLVSPPTPRPTPNPTSSPTPDPNSIDRPECGYGTPVCECNSEKAQCIINLEIDELRTFTSYRKFPVDAGDGIFVRGAQGVIYDINDDGEMEYLEQYKTRHCAVNFNRADCSDPQFVDGKTYRMAIGVNGQIPGPTIIVHDGQMITINVHNNMSSEGISIHWHGMHQADTPWMDGVGQITQCQIGPSSSFSYIYKASPSGTFWYHSHSGAQRTDGFFGALIVRERGDLSMVKQLLGIDFEDHPDKHTISLLDWQHEISLDLFSQLHAGLGFYETVPIGAVPPNDADSRYESTRSFEEGEVGPVPYYSGLINGKGRHNDVPYVKTRLSIFPVTSRSSYRFRLIGAQGLYAYKFSIDGHKLVVVNTDGYWTRKTDPADYIIIHTGERYDFILTADATPKDYWIRAETLEIDRSSNGGKPPYKSLGHVAEAILQYTDNIDKPRKISSAEYRSIKFNSPLRECSPDNMCLAINCPFQNFHSAYHTNCFNVNQLKLLLPTEPGHLPDAVPDSDCGDCLHFFNFNFEGDSETSAVNGRNFVLPPVPPQTQYNDFTQQAKICDLNADCNPSSLSCLCTQVVNVAPFNKTIQFVFSAIGAYQNAHPIHLHGHTFHVVHIGYPEYDQTTGFVNPDKHSDDIHCGDQCSGDECKRCTKPSWNENSKPNINIDKYTVRKDTVIIPAGGYAVINFLSDNPGFWFLHCHIEVHQLEGMSVVINEAFDQQLSAPAELNKCGDFDLTVDKFQAILRRPRELKAAAAE